MDASQAIPENETRSNPKGKHISFSETDCREASRQPQGKKHRAEQQGIFFPQVFRFQRVNLLAKEKQYKVHKGRSLQRDIRDQFQNHTQKPSENETGKISEQGNTQPESSHGPSSSDVKVQESILMATAIRFRALCTSQGASGSALRDFPQRRS